jgi:hypothetical protein
MPWKFNFWAYNWGYLYDNSCTHKQFACSYVVDVEELGERGSGPGQLFFF